MSANDCRDCGDNGITSERVTRAKSKLLNAAAAMESNATKYAECPAARAVLEKANGKKITRRLYDALAKAWGAERVETRWSGHYWRGLEWSDETFLSRHFHVKIDTNCGFRQELPLKHDGCLLNSAATIAEWDKLAAQWREWARGKRAAAECVEFAAAEYNAIWARARAACAEIEKQCRPSGLINPEITVLCAFGGDIYDRLNAFRWHESKAVED